MICNNSYAVILRVCEIKDLIWVMSFQSPYIRIITKSSYRAKVAVGFKSSEYLGHFIHWGIQNHFQTIVWSLKNKKAQQLLQFAEISSRKEGPSFHNLTFLLMRLRYSCKWCLMSSNIFRQIMMDETSSRLQSTNRKIKSNVIAVISEKRRSIF